MALTEDERKAHLTALGLSPDGDTLTAVVEPDVEAPAKAKKAKKAKKDKPKKDKPTKEVTITTPALRPEDPNDIAFDTSMLDGFVLDGSDMKAASDKLFAAYKYPRKDPRNSLLHRLITEFIQRVKRERNPSPKDGYLKGKVKAGKGQRDLAQMLAQHNLTADDLAGLLDALKASK